MLRCVIPQVALSSRLCRAAACRLIGADRKFAAERQTDGYDPSATWAGSADQLAVPADDSTVAFMRLKRAVDAVDETLPDSGRVEQMLPNVAERKRRLKEQVRIRHVDGQIASECPRVHRPLVQINGDLFPVYVDRVALGTRKAPRPAFQIDRLGMCSRCS